MSTLTKDQLLAPAELKREEREIPGLGPVLMREMSVNERLENPKRRKTIAKEMGEGAEEGDVDFVASLHMVARVLCAEGGTPMFADTEIPRAVEALKQRSQATVTALQKAFLEVNGMGEGALEEALGNSEEIPSDASSSPSPGISDTTRPRALQTA